MEKPPKEVSDWMREIQSRRKTKRGGRKIRDNTEKGEKNRQRVRTYRQRQKASKEEK